MGDRSNVFVQQNKREDGTWDGIGIYSHWHGTDLHEAALAAVDLAKRRTGDPSYFARIIIHNVLLKLADPNSETGFGLWTTTMDDNEHDILVFNAETGEHWYAGENAYRHDR